MLVISPVFLLLFILDPLHLWALLTAYFISLGLCVLLLWSHYYRYICLQFLQWFQAMIGNILFKLPWSMLVWLVWMLTHGGIWTNMFGLSYVMSCWYHVLYTCTVFICCFPMVLSTIQQICTMFYLRKISSFVIWTFLCLKTSLHPASQNFPMKINELYVGPDMIWTSSYFGGSSSNVNVNSLFDIIITPFGRITLIGRLLAVVC